jgi:hypothetical protein
MPAEVPIGVAATSDERVAPEERLPAVGRSGVDDGLTEVVGDPYPWSTEYVRAVLPGQGKQAVGPPGSCRGAANSGDPLVLVWMGVLADQNEVLLGPPDVEVVVKQVVAAEIDRSEPVARICDDDAGVPGAWQVPGIADQEVCVSSSDLAPAVVMNFGPG